MIYIKIARNGYICSRDSFGFYDDYEEEEPEICFDKEQVIEWLSCNLPDCES